MMASKVDAKQIAGERDPTFPTAKKYQI